MVKGHTYYVRLAVAELMAGYYIQAWIGKEIVPFIVWNKPIYLPKADKFMWQASTYEQDRPFEKVVIVHTLEEALSLSFTTFTDRETYEKYYKYVSYHKRLDLARKFLEEKRDRYKVQQINSQSPATQGV